MSHLPLKSMISDFTLSALVYHVADNINTNCIRLFEKVNAMIQVNNLAINKH